MRYTSIVQRGGAGKITAEAACFQALRSASASTIRKAMWGLTWW